MSTLIKSAATVAILAAAFWSLGVAYRHSERDYWYRPRQRRASKMVSAVGIAAGALTLIASVWSQ